MMLEKKRHTEETQINIRLERVQSREARVARRGRQSIDRSIRAPRRAKF